VVSDRTKAVVLVGLRGDPRWMLLPRKHLIVPASEPIVICDFDPSWPARFQAIGESLRVRLGAQCSASTDSGSHASDQRFAQRDDRTAPPVPASDRYGPATELLERSLAEARAEFASSSGS